MMLLRLMGWLCIGITNQLQDYKPKLYKLIVSMKQQLWKGAFYCLPIVVLLIGANFIVWGSNEASHTMMPLSELNIDSFSCKIWLCSWLFWSCGNVPRFCWFSKIIKIWWIILLRSCLFLVARPVKAVSSEYQDWIMSGYLFCKSSASGVNVVPYSYIPWVILSFAM